MFNNLTDYSRRRTTKEAVGFYIAYFVLILALSLLIGTLAGIVRGNENSFNFGVQLGTMVATITSLTLSFLILNAKGLVSNYGYILLALLSGVLGYVGGGLLGLLIPAYLSTKGKR